MRKLSLLCVEKKAVGVHSLMVSKNFDRKFISCVI